MSGSDALAEEVDFAIAAYRDEGEWSLVELAPDLAQDVDDLLDGLRRWPSDVGVLGLVSVNDEFFVLARVTGRREQLLLSDVTAVEDWPIAAGVADVLEVPDPDEDDEAQPAGDLAILADLGVTAIDMAVLLDDPDLYPDDVLAQIADRIGFGDSFEDLIG